MKNFTIVIIILFFVLLNSLNFIVGVLQTPANSVFLGTTHWPGDYFYYLSQFAQGKESWFAGYDLYTSDFPQKTFAGWVNVFWGRVFHLLGVNQMWAYQISVAIFTAIFLALSYLLIKEIFEGNGGNGGDGGDRWKSVVAFTLFNFANAWPAVQTIGGKINLFHHDYWFNNGLPLNRLVGVPHQMLGKAMLVAALLLFVWWMKGRRNIWVLLGTVLVSITLVSVEPVHWGLVVVVMFIASIVKKFSIFNFQSSIKSQFSNLKNKNFDFISNFKFQISNYFLSIVFFFSGLPILLYLKKLFILPPYSQLAAWEATQQQYVGVWHFLASNGPVVLLGFLGIFFFVRKLASQGLPLQGWPRMIAVVFTVLTVGLFFSPIPAMISVVNVRFLPAVTTIFFAVLATEGVYRLPKRRLLLAVVFILSLLPLRLQIQRRITLDTNNAYYYVPQSVMTVFNQAEKISKPTDTFLVIWPFNVPFPGVAGRRVYTGHHLLTIDSSKKEEFAWKFFDGQMSNAQMRDFLSKNNINFIISYSWTEAVKRLESLENIYDNGYLAVYKVN